MSAQNRMPSGLGAAGRTVWRAVVDDLTAVGDDDATWELDGRERLILENAARQADLNAKLEAVIEEDGIVVAGSTGQRRLNAAATELRQGRVAVGKLLGELALPGEDGRVATARQKRARGAAEVRWGHRGAA